MKGDKCTGGGGIVRKVVGRLRKSNKTGTTVLKTLTALDSFYAEAFAVASSMIS